jgi:phosphomannomutase
MGGFFLPEIFARHPEFEAVPLYWELDGSFPNHEADPMKEENLRDVQALGQRTCVATSGGYDGDAIAACSLITRGQHLQRPGDSFYRGKKCFAHAGWSDSL